MQKHFEKKHPGKECPPDGIVSAEEKEILRKKKENSKNNLLISEDFWDAKTKKWKQNNYGIFGKQQTARMKRLFGENNFQ